MKPQLIALPELRIDKEKYQFKYVPIDKILRFYMGHAKIGGCKLDQQKQPITDKDKKEKRKKGDSFAGSKIEVISTGTHQLAEYYYILVLVVELDIAFSDEDDVVTMFVHPDAYRYLHKAYAITPDITLPDDLIYTPETSPGRR